jgi:hypothetical protein
MIKDKKWKQQEINNIKNRKKGEGEERVRYSRWQQTEE